MGLIGPAFLYNIALFHGRSFVAPKHSKGGKKSKGQDPEMFGRVRAASSTLDCLELEKPPSKLIKDDSFSIYGILFIFTFIIYFVNGLQSFESAILLPEICLASIGLFFIYFCCEK